MSEKHSHPDFQNGRPHNVDRKHRILGEKRGGGTPKDYKILELDPDRERALREYRQALEAIPVHMLKGAQLESRDICGNSHKTKKPHGLKHPMDGHWHGHEENGLFYPICCACLLELRGIECQESWTKVKGLRKKIHDITESLPYHYWRCKDCNHKWRNKNPKPRECSNCESDNVKEVKGVSNNAEGGKQQHRGSRV